MDPANKPDPEKRRHEAEAALRLHRPDRGDVSPLSQAEAQRLVHELQVHQIELQMQNEELQRTRAEAESSLARYTELYDFAPIGFLSVDRAGVILEVNFAGAKLLGQDRARLLNRRLDAQVVPSARPSLAALLAEAFAGEHKVVGTLPLLADGELIRHVQLEIVRSPGGTECRVAALDVTTSKRLEAEREKLIADLQASQAHVQTLHGLLPICAGCKNIRDEAGHWQQLEVYIQSRSEAHFTHGLCPACVTKFYPNLYLAPEGSTDQK